MVCGFRRPRCQQHLRWVSSSMGQWAGCAEKAACPWLQAANVLINHDGRVVLSDFGVTANLERATPSSLRKISHSQASTSDAAGVQRCLPAQLLHCDWDLDQRARM